MTKELPHRGYAETPLGQLHYAEQGTGRPILLLHQTPRSLDEFREVQPLLSSHARSIAMDMVGFGMSPVPQAPQTIEQMADGAFALLDALGIRTAVVLGHHTGGAVAVEMAARSPERVDGLVLSSTPNIDQLFRTKHEHGVGVDEAEVREDGAHLTALWQMRLPYYPESRPDLLNRFVHDALAPGVDPAEGHRACARFVMEDRIKLVTAPVQIIGASDDPFALPDVEPLRAALANSSHVDVAVIDGGTIPLMEHKPAEVAETVLHFMAGLPA